MSNCLMLTTPGLIHKTQSGNNIQLAGHVLLGLVRNLGLISLLSLPNNAEEFK